MTMNTFCNCNEQEHRNNIRYGTSVVPFPLFEDFVQRAKRLSKDAEEDAAEATCMERVWQAQARAAEDEACAQAVGADLPAHARGAPYTRNYLLHPDVKGWHPLILDNHPYKFLRLEPGSESTKD